MARFFGKVGYEITEETAPDVYTPRIVERSYYGDIDRMINHVQQSSQVNPDLTLNMQVRIVADAFAYEHFQDIRYVEAFNSKWKATAAEVGRPRITLNLGGPYTEGDVSEQS